MNRVFVIALVLSGIIIGWPFVNMDTIQTRNVHALTRSDMAIISTGTWNAIELDIDEYCCTNCIKYKEDYYIVEKG